jgi:hypothetical protein
MTIRVAGSGLPPRSRRKPRRDRHGLDFDKAAMAQLTEQQSRRLLERLPAMLTDEQVPARCWH